MSDKNLYLATADWHLSIRPYGFKHREQDVYNAAFKIVDIAQKYDIKTIFNGGDIIDVIRPSSTSIVILSQINKRLINNQTTMYVVEGNHDKTHPHWINALENDSQYGIKLLNNEIVKLPGGKLLGGIGQGSKNEILENLSLLTDNGKNPLDYVILHTSVIEFIKFSGNNDTISFEDLKKDIQKTF